MFKFIKKDPFILLVIALAVGAGWWLLLPGYFNMHDDLQLMRQLAMEECFKELQLPCRWTPHMGYGFGFPLFNYYPPLPYVIGELFRVVGLSFITTVKLTFFLSFILSGITMYILGREFWGRWGGLLSATFYIWAPYHSLDIYVRGAMNEAWALIWFPLILWSAYKVITRAQFRHIVMLALSWFALFTSHNLMVIIFAPLFAAWCLLWLAREKSWFTVPQLIVAGVWSFGLAAFFTIPVLLEKQFVHVETLVVGYYEYVAHFANINQLLMSRFWGYGASAWLEGDKMAFPVGHMHWIISLVVAGVMGARFWKTRKVDTPLLITGFFFAVGWLAAFMSHVRSTPIWQAIPPLAFVQFPWRFLTLVTLSFSIVAGMLPGLLGKKTGKIAVIALIAGVILWNLEFFRPERMGPLTDLEKFSGAAWELQQTAGIYDYLPKEAYTAPKAPQKTVADVVEGKGEMKDGSQGTNWAKFTLNIESEQARVRVNIFKFPGWKILVDGKETEIKIDKDEWGRMHITVPQGEHTINVKLENTPARTAGNLVSLVSWGALLTVPFWRKRYLR
jgi:hypothetical protein